MTVIFDPFDRSISKKLSHKSAVSETFITHFEESLDGMRIFAELPRSHGFYCENMVEIRHVDPLLLVEICRQACFVVAHHQFSVPLAGSPNQFLFQELDIKFVRPVRMPAGHPLGVELTSTIEKQWRRGDTVSGLRWRFRIQADGEQLADCVIQMMWIERPKWKQMRGTMRRSRKLSTDMTATVPLRSGVAPHEVGRRNADNVLIAEITGERDEWAAQTRIDTRHPVLFDHSIDHIFAMVQLEIARQLGSHILGKLAGSAPALCYPREIRANFMSVGELDVETLARARILEALTGEATRDLQIRLAQGERQISHQTWRYFI